MGYEGLIRGKVRVRVIWGRAKNLHRQRLMEQKPTGVKCDPYMIHEELGGSGKAN